MTDLAELPLIGGTRALGMRFALTYAAIAAVLFGVYGFPFELLGAQGDWLAGYLAAYARLSGGVLELIEPGVVVSGAGIHGRFPIEIVRNCPLLMPVELRTLVFLPTVAFIALALALPLGSPRKNLRLLLLGLPVLELLLLVLLALPLASFLGGLGPIRAFSLGAPLHAILQILYRALVAPPGMAYALPLLLWWVLVVKLRARPLLQTRQRTPSADESWRRQGAGLAAAAGPLDISTVARCVEASARRRDESRA